MRDLIQRGLLATNPHWPFSVINRAPYRLALAVVGHRFGRLRGVSGVHLRNGLTRPDWVPGLSDIDLTVVIDDVGAAGDAALTRAIWTEYGRLKRAFPMLGELAILPRRALGAWSRFGITGHEVGTWIALVGPRVGALDYHANPLRVRVDAANHALLFFTDVLLPRYVGGSWQTPVGRRAVVRIADKVRRYARQAAADVDGPTRMPEPPGAAVARALLTLDAAVRTADFDGVWADAAAGVAPADTGRVPSGEPRDVPGAEHLLSSIMRVYGTTIAVVRAGLAEDQVAVCLGRLAKHLGADRRLLVVTPAVLEHLLRHQDPFLYTALQASGEAIVGGDALLPRPPHARAFDHAVLLQAQNVLSAARSYGVASGDDRARVSGVELALAVTRAIAIKGWLRTGTVPMSYGAMVDWTARVDGASSSRLAEIRTRAATPGGAIGADAFGLLRDLADEVARDIVERGADRRIFRALAGGMSQGDGAEPK